MGQSLGLFYTGTQTLNELEVMISSTSPSCPLDALHKRITQVGIVALSFNLTLLEQRWVELWEFKASLICVESLRPARLPSEISSTKQSLTQNENKQTKTFQV